MLEVSKCGNVLLVGTDTARVAAYSSRSAMQHNLRFVFREFGGLVGHGWME